ncbi:MarR family transcriptional regulator [Dactylosporangium vinaceum]|uniref:MarR family winged helix-turn-helix transcriptional regulator n=1 Tax=Dactylosporangium vinaceum TaxID=53362 RepID=A0ABV5MC37_9ACTN|nr:MarR family transcriptional regulator [Dactylosporangium vinaceum]UAB92050.1 MarR family transcriptional regulator [Dactylosporangium vinaceum]
MPDPAASQAADDLVALFRRLRARLRRVPSGSLTPSQAAVLLRLHRDGASSTTVLALAEGVRSQSMTATLNALGDLGLIERAADPEDGRRQLITLSPAGRARALADRQERHAWLAAELDRRFTPAELATIAEALTLLTRLDDPGR